MTRHPDIRSVIERQLEKEIPEATKALREEMASLAAGHATGRSMREISFSLLEIGIPMARLLSALLRCEWTNLQHLLRETRESDINREIELLTSTVDHFNELQASIVAAGEYKWNAALHHEKKARVLAECRVQWMENRTVKLYNYFFEVPVKGSAELMGMEGNELKIAFSPELTQVFSAAPDMHSAYIGTPNKALRILVRVLKRQGDALMLDVEEVETDYPARRKDVRVRLTSPISLRLEGRKKIKCQLVDVSVTGLGLALPDNVSLSIGEKFSCLWTLDSMEIKCPATVRWNSEYAGKNKAGLEIKPAKKDRDAIRKYMLAQQRLIIGRLRKLGMPPWALSQSGQ